MDEVIPTKSEVTLSDSPESCIFVTRVAGDTLDVVIRNHVLKVSDAKLDDKELEQLIQSIVSRKLDPLIWSIDLSHNSISFRGVELLCKEIPNHFHNLVTLDLSYNRIGDSGVGFLYNALKERLNARMGFFTHIGFTGSEISCDGAKIIHKMIRRSNGSLNVSFENNAINGEGIGYIFSAKYWESFTVDNNTLDVTYPFFMKHLTSHSFMLKELRILNNNLSPSNVRQLPKLIASLALPSLRVLYLGERLWDEGVSNLFESDAIQKLINLESLHLVDTYVKSTGFIAFLRSFRHSSFPRLVEAVIQENNYFRAVFRCSQSGYLNEITDVTFEMLGKSDFSTYLAPLFCIESLQRLEMRCGFNHVAFAAFADAARKGFLQRLQSIEVWNAVYCYSDVQIMTSIALPATETIVLNGASIVQGKSPERQDSIEKYRGNLFDRGSHASVVALQQRPINSVILQNTQLGDQLIPLFVVPLSEWAAFIDIRKNHISDDAVYYLYKRLAQAGHSNVKTLLIDEENLSERSKLYLYKITHWDDSKVDSEIAQFEKEMPPRELDFIEIPQEVPPRKACCCSILFFVFSIKQSCYKSLCESNCESTESLNRIRIERNMRLQRHIPEEQIQHRNRNRKQQDSRHHFPPFRARGMLGIDHTTTAKLHLTPCNQPHDKV